MNINRRQAVQIGAVSAISYSRSPGANDRIGVGVIGTGNRGSYVMTVFQKNQDVEVRALCDVYAVRIDKAKERAPNTKSFSDHRQLLELKEIDAVLIGTPDHWHKDHAIDAMIAATAKVHRLTVVTRNVIDFAPFSVPTINPFAR